MSKTKEAVLVLADGKVFRGEACGHIGEASGEVVFNTSMTGYQEILTDPSYANQLLTFTYPHIGNVGCNSEDVESFATHAKGVIVRKFSNLSSNYRSEMSFQDWLEKNELVGISGVDTRELVLHLRDNGSQMGIVSSSRTDVEAILADVKALPGIEGQDLVKEVTCKEPYTWSQGTWKRGQGYSEHAGPEFEKRKHIVAIDFGVKFNILRLLVDQGFRVTVVPASTSAEEIEALKPDGVFLSNGPGDPAVVTYGIETVKALKGKYPMFGICLGHQILGHALGAPTFKLPFGHRGGNHPVKDQKTGKIEITVQNHGFATDAEKVPADLKVSHMNLNDKTVEGFSIDEIKTFSIQYHPESSPGPRDAEYLFARFAEMVEQGI